MKLITIKINPITAIYIDYNKNNKNETSLKTDAKRQINTQNGMYITKKSQIYDQEISNSKSNLLF